MAKAQTHISAETDLYRPVHDYLVDQGYTVRSEVKNCDIAAIRGDDLIIIELKRTLSLALIAQAVRRQEITNSVYVAVPRPHNRKRWDGQSRDVRALLRRLEIGLILVGSKRCKRPVDIVFHPLPAERRKRKHKHTAVIQEIERRSADFNEGGSCRRKLVTAYRENAVQIACCLAELGQQSPKQLRTLGTGEKTLSILYRNVYGWFQRVDKGIYAISPKGIQDLAQYPELVNYYKKQPCQE
ncbi:MAG: DUF2161 family putative PD-(D/E)XK-type phosphodiesterase [Armatimonadota bacterium]|nr:DUF2161 family putative PD-(D/E)XK-type phosphodiesterase [bacterium]